MVCKIMIDTIASILCSAGVDRNGCSSSNSSISSSIILEVSFGRISVCLLSRYLYLLFLHGTDLGNVIELLLIYLV